jgi:hypothetical protein
MDAEVVLHLCYTPCVQPDAPLMVLRVAGLAACGAYDLSCTGVVRCWAGHMLQMIQCMHMHLKDLKELEVAQDSQFCCARRVRPCASCTYMWHTIGPSQEQV